MTEFRYKAFISYSWADAAWGKWLHHALETYRTPAALVGKDGALGPVAARLIPLFKDREEEAAGASIGKAVEAALAGSEFLIVVCSPRSAASAWVNREVAWFKTHRDPNRILALIVDGEPGGGEAECFPRALTHRVEPDLTITAEPEDAPLAADARVSGDGKRMARLKLAAALLGVGLDELVGRDDRRRALRQRWVTAGSLLFGGSMAGLAWFAIQARDEADHQRAESDSLVEFMLTDLREKLEPVGRLDALDVVGQRALKYYAQQDPGSLDADSLGRRSRALHLVGEVTNIRGDSAGGLVAFRQAAKTTAELLAREPDDQQRIFDHAQSVFWVGYIAYERGENKEAGAQLREYKRLATRLVELNPRKKEWQLESSYAETNLGVMYDKLGRYREAEKAFAGGLKAIEAVAASEPYSADRQVEVGTMVNWLGSTNNSLGKLRESIAQHRREIALYEALLRHDPANVGARNRLAIAHNFIAAPLLSSGDLEGSIAANDRALALIAPIRRLEPGNTEWQQTETATLFQATEAKIYAGRYSEGRDLIERATALSAKLVATDPTNVEWTVGFRMRTWRCRIMLALAQRQHDAARQLAAKAINDLPTHPDGTANSVSIYRMAGDAEAGTGGSDRATAYWAKSLALMDDRPANDLERFIVLKRLGRRDDAAALARLLDRRGFRHPAYLRERRFNP